MSWCHQSYLTKRVDAFWCSTCNKQFCAVNDNNGWYERYSGVRRRDVAEIRCFKCFKCFHGDSEPLQLVPRPYPGLELARRRNLVDPLRHDGAQLTDDLAEALATVNPADPNSCQALVVLADKLAVFSARLRAVARDWAEH